MTNPVGGRGNDTRPEYIDTANRSSDKVAGSCTSSLALRDRRQPLHFSCPPSPHPLHRQRTRNQLSMIVDKIPLPDDATPTEPPPSYDALSANPQLTYAADGKSPKQHQDQLQPEQSPQSPSSSSRPNWTPTSSASSRPPQAKKQPFSFKFWGSRTSREVRTTVQGLIRDLVREQALDASAPIGILRSCADACANNALSLSDLLQEKSIEGHTPLYWAVLKRRPEEEITEETTVPDLLTALLSFAAPLKPDAISEIRVACLLSSDQLLFQRLRMTPEFSSVSPADQMLLGEGVPPDSILVEDVPGDEGSFVAHFEIVRFQKRMWVSKEIVLEFIARARLWRLAFSITPDGQSSGPKPGSWCLHLSILETSPPTWVDAQFIVPEPTPQPSASSSSPSLLSVPSASGSSSGAASAAPTPPSPRSFGAGLGLTRQKPRPTVMLRLKSNKQLVTAQALGSRRNQYDVETEIVAPLEESMMGSSLQYA
ncbi:hypothetical protein AX16_010751 [Volvariella volvacea WC 439]|nr:hypothetical protein AX16_010751 [Volvariella volvacea WC 439]